MQKLKTNAVRFLVGAVIGFCFLGAESQAKDLQGRLGLGFNNQFSYSPLEQSSTIPALSLKYSFSRGVAASLAAGVMTSTPTRSVLAAKFYKNIFYETNLNFYAMLGGGLVVANELSGAEFLGGFGTEFFIPGIESLGFSVELGAAFGNITGSFIVRTMGASFLGAGIHFYF